MHVVSINVGKQQTIQINGRALATGIFKQPISGKVSINTTGLAGDTVADITRHSGIDQAIYLAAFVNTWHTQNSIGLKQYAARKLRPFKVQNEES